MQICVICAPIFFYPLNRLLYILPLLFFTACIGDDIVEDIVDPTLRITNPLVEMEIGTEYQFEVMYFNSSGSPAIVSLEWTSSDTTVATVGEFGLVTALSYGEVTIEVKTGNDIITSSSNTFEITDETISQPQRSGSLATTSSYTLEGDFILSEEEDGLRLTLMGNYLASSSLPGLEVYLTNNPNTTNGAYEIGPVSVFSGSHFYDIPAEVDLFEYSHVLYFCAPFNVKVGDGVFLD